jgi:hypothetical protein
MGDIKSWENQEILNWKVKKWNKYLYFYKFWEEYKYLTIEWDKEFDDINNIKSWENGEILNW